MTTVEIYTIAAIIIGPIIAVVLSIWIQNKYQERLQKHNAKLTILGQIVSTRNDILGAESVRAMNMIDLVFSEGEDTEVRTRWAAFVDSIRSTGIPAEDHLKRYNRLIAEMCKVLGYGEGFTYYDAERVMYATSGSVTMVSEIQTELLSALKATNAILTARNQETAPARNP